MNMVYYFIFPIVVIIASIIGAIAGIGGGVIIRPVLDAFGYFSTPEITNMISTMCVVFGTSTSIIRHVASKSKIENWKTAVYLGVGAVIGGVVGQFLFQFVRCFNYYSIFNFNCIINICSYLYATFVTKR